MDDCITRSMVTIYMEDHNHRQNGIPVWLAFLQAYMMDLSIPLWSLVEKSY